MTAAPEPFLARPTPTLNRSPAPPGDDAKIEHFEDAAVIAQCFGADTFHAAVAIERHQDIRVSRTNEPSRFLFEIRPLDNRSAEHVIAGSTRLLLVGQGEPHLETRCPCRVPHCEHGVATYLRLLANAKPGLRAHWQAAVADLQPLSAELRAWLRELPRPVPSAAEGAASGRAPKTPAETDIVFVLGEDDAPQRLTRVVSMRAKQLRNGEGYGRTATPFLDWKTLLKADRDDEPILKSLSSVRAIDVSWISPEQRRLAKELFLANALPQNGVLSLKDMPAAEVLPLLVTSGHLCWGTAQGPRLKLGPARPAQVAWQYTGAVGWRLQVLTVPASSHFISSEPVWYCDPAKGEIGPLQTSVPGDLLQAVLSAPTVPTAALPMLRATLAQIPHAAAHLPPPPAVPIVKRGAVRPLPILTLHSDLCGEVAPGWTLEFDYNGQRYDHIAEGTFTEETERQIIITERDTAFERACVERLQALGLSMGLHDGSRTLRLWHDAGRDMDSVTYCLDFQHEPAAALRAEGWVVLLDPAFAFRRIEGGDPQWQISLDPTEPGWFEASMGVDIAGRRVDLVPIVVELMRKRDVRALLKEKTAGHFYHPLPGGEWLRVPIARLRQVASLLIGLEDADRGAKPKVSQFDLGWLDVVESVEGVQVTGPGHAQLVATASSLAAEPKDVPACIKDHPDEPMWTSQRVGIGWLQALMKHGFGGVLADNMGLGKTRIVLTHLLAEKLTGRAKGTPSIGIMSRNLFRKWEREARKFASELQVVRLHGSSRQELYDSIAEADVVLMNYDTMTADIEWIMERKWHVAFLDEGHRIGNTTIQRTKAATQIPARQRIVISGTPMQNRSEEYWSVFNFAVPGLLRTRHWFREHFVKGVVGTDQEIARMNLLGQLTAPFLRKTPRDEVKNDLPPLTIKVYPVEFEDEQRQLYETVRLRLSKEVREQIAKHGLGRSQITVLSAITQLRQVCCDPSLLSLEAAKTCPSAKLETLRELIPEFIAGAHRPIIFSQWTEMLARISTLLNSVNVSHSVYTGKMSIKKQEAAEDAFRSGAVDAILMSLKLSEGIDLPEGDTVIIFDPWWNPKAEEQAIKRAHRQGQKNPVLALRMIVAGSIEEGIIALGERKGAVAEAILEGTTKGLEKITVEDIDMLFRPLGDNE